MRKLLSIVAGIIFCIGTVSAEDFENDSGDDPIDSPIVLQKERKDKHKRVPAVNPFVVYGLYDGEDMLQLVCSEYAEGDYILTTANGGYATTTQVVTAGELEAGVSVGANLSMIRLTLPSGVVYAAEL